MWLIYDLLIEFILFAAHIGSLFNFKIRQFLKSRTVDVKLEINQTKKTILFHCASLGEYEMIIPLIEELKRQSEVNIAITFFSPSGYNNVHEGKLVDSKYYLPFDTTRRVSKFINEINPSLVVFVKYDFWFNFIRIVQSHRIPIAVINGLYRKDKWPFSFLGKMFKKQLLAINYYSVQDDSSQIALESFGIESNKIQIAPDMRFDRVIGRSEDIVENKLHDPIFSNDWPILILGSSWPAEEQIVASIWNNFKENFNLIIVPHDISEKHIQWIEDQFKPFGTRRINHKKPLSNEILIVNVIGKLAELYHHANVSFVGGAFGAGLHNILEAAVFENFIITGPNITKYPEALEFQKIGSLKSIKTSDELAQLLADIIEQSALYKDLGQRGKRYIQKKAGSSHKVALMLQDLY